MKLAKVAVVALVAICATSAYADLLITEVVDATLPGGNPKYVEITNTGAADYTFAEGGIICQSNAYTDLDIDIPLAGVTIPAGYSYVIQTTYNDGQNVFETTYGFAADLYYANGMGNGDDRFILTDTDDSSNLIDIYGEINVDGSNTPWEYTDSFASRNYGSTPNGGVFAIGEWYIPGPNFLEDSGGDDVIEAALIVANTSPGVWVPEPASFALLGLGAFALIRRR